MILIVEVVNYIEHYGLERVRMNTDKPNEEAIYEAVGHHHSWNAP